MSAQCIESGGDVFFVDSSDTRSPAAGLARSWAMANADLNRVYEKPAPKLKAVKPKAIPKPVPKAPQKPRGSSFDIDNYQFAVGTRFGDWQVIGRSVRRSGSGGRSMAYVPCKCACGFEAHIFHSSLVNGQSKNCQPCGNRKAREKREKSGENVVRFNGRLFNWRTFKVDTLIKALNGKGFTLTQLESETGLTRRALSDWRNKIYRPRALAKAESIVDFACKHLTDAELEQCEVYR